MSIVIVDYGMGNCRSILNMIKYASDGKARVTISNNHKDILNADKIILPGVGAFDHGISNIKKLNLKEMLDEVVLSKKTVALGICLGMQLMTNSSEEGTLPGFGWVDAKTTKFILEDKYKVPHIGWNYISIKNKSVLLNDIDDNFRFYFVHSYYVSCSDQSNIICKTWYGHEFVSAFQKGNIYGVQFHPEKSHKYGLRIIKNFLDI